jgi:hypothetical protein
MKIMFHHHMMSFHKSTTNAIMGMKQTKIVARNIQGSCDITKSTILDDDSELDVFLLCITGANIASYIFRR